MAVTEFINHLRADYQELGGKTTFRISIENAWEGVLCRSFASIPIGEKMTDKEWDLLIILDACRYDLMGEVLEEYEFLSSNQPFISSGASSSEWLRTNFLTLDCLSLLEKIRVLSYISMFPGDHEYVGDTFHTKDFTELAMVSGNPFTRILDSDSFSVLDELWRYARDDTMKVVPPRNVTERAIDILRQGEHERAVVHYMQPHIPFRAERGWEKEGSLWRRFQQGKKKYEEVWAEYIDNLRWVLDEVDILLTNVDAETVVISADHGNAVGEYGLYGHRPNIPFKCERKVPWVKTTAVNEETFDPTLEMGEEDLDEDELHQHLRELGYL